MAGPAEPLLRWTAGPAFVAAAPLLVVQMLAVSVSLPGLILRTAMLFRPLRVFAPIIILSLTYGIVKMIIDLLIVGDRNISASALLGFLSALLVLLIGMLGDALATRLGRFSPAAVAGVGSRDVADSDLENVPDRLT